MSRGIVSLRSGLTECLLQTNVPIFSLYTKFRNRYIFNDMQVEYVFSGFGLNKLPHIDSKKIHEFNMSEVNNNQVIKAVIDNLKNEKNIKQFENEIKDIEKELNDSK